ncbi:hypothetical protein INR49_021454 [Caranx melampygus]|nr:hypothetical protein INR49_021454 [Caranx melampygus]
MEDDSFPDRSCFTVHKAKEKKRETRGKTGLREKEMSPWSINAAANLALPGYEHAASADIRRADLSLSLFISCLACNHPVSGCCMISTIIKHPTTTLHPSPKALYLQLSNFLFFSCLF